MNYPVQIIFNKIESSYQLIVPDLPGCKVISFTVDEAMKKLHSTIAAHLKILVEYGEPIPLAQKIDHYMHKSFEGTSDEKIVWAIIEFDIVPYLGKSHKINVTLPELLIKQIDDRVSKSEQYKTRSGFIATVCLKELSK